jgi:hypothetical protein
LAQLNVERYDGVIQKQVPRWVNAQRCQNVLGDLVCAVNLESHKFETTIASIHLQDGRQIEIAGLLTEEGDDGSRFVGGTLFRVLSPGVWVVAGRINFRSSGDWIVLLDPNPNLATNDPVKLYPACDRLITTCDARYDNVVRFTGTMPLGNPNRSIMDGTGFLGHALEEDTTEQGTTTDPAPRPRG